MIEVIYKEEKKEAEGNEAFFRIPRNIRQIGEPGGEHRIYIEDYAHTFLEKLTTDGKKEGKTAILMGQINWQEGVSYTFIRGALLVENLDAAPEKVAFTEEIWTWIEEKQKQYFSGQDIVGWFYTMPDLSMEVSDSFYRAHLNYFGGNDKVFFLKDPTEQEEAFFVYENGHMSRQTGYYIYYEKNQQMQEYMIAVKGNSTVDTGEAVEDQAVVSFRKIIAGKKEKKGEQERKTPVLMYAASACLTLTVLAVGINFLNGYQKMQNVTENVTENVKEVVGGPDSVTKSPEILEKVTEDPEMEQEEEEQDTTVESVEQENALQKKEKQEEEQVSSSPTPTPAEEEETQANSYEAYTVQLGDSLYKISTGRYGTMDMIPEICRINGISTEDIIYPGQKILLP